MMSDLPLRRKWTLRAHGNQVVLVKKPGESGEHVIMKALLWALYLPLYPDLTVEVPVGDRYKPDLVSLDAQGRPADFEPDRIDFERIHQAARLTALRIICVSSAGSVATVSAFHAVA